MTRARKRIAARMIFAGLLCAGAAFGAAQGQTASVKDAPIPNFSPSSAMGWLKAVGGDEFLPPGSLNNIVWINDGAIGNFGWIKLEGIDFQASYDFDAGDLGVFSAGISGAYYLHQYGANHPTVTDPNPEIVDDFHQDIGTLGGLVQLGVTTSPRMKYRARLGWTDGPWSVTGFMNYVGHYYNTQNAPPNVNNQCIAAGSTIGGGTFPCAISGYTGLSPSWYTFDLSFGYTTGDVPANDYLKNIGVQFIVQNITNRLSPFQYQIAAGSAPSAFDVSKNNTGRTFGLVLTKAW